MITNSPLEIYNLIIPRGEENESNARTAYTVAGDNI